MGLGVLEDSKLDHVPGTSYVNESTDVTHRQPDQQQPWLKYDRSGPVPILLIPQPSDDPYDPLNWPLWRRDLILAILSLVAVICTTMSPIMAANTVTIALAYRRDFTQVALLTGYHLLGVGLAGILCVPTARIWGKRHLFIFGNILMIISAAWAGGSTGNWRSLVAARVFQGFALAPFEALVNACVGDLYFMHERGKRMAFSNVALFGGAFLTPVVVGKMTETLGWQWSFYFVAIFTAAGLPLIFFFVPETAYRRADYLNPDFSGDADVTNSQTDIVDPASQLSADARNQNVQEKQHLSGPTNEITPKTRNTQYSYWQTLKLFNGRKTDENFIKLFLRPFPLFFHPGILWACLTQGVLIGWTVFIGVVLAAVFLGPPLWFDQVKTGYLYTGAFIGSILGLIFSGLLSDWINKRMIKLNKGTYEPEFRIVLVFFQLLFSGIGLYGFGITAENVRRYGWLIPDVFFAFVVMGMVMGAVSSALYIVDAHRQIAVEAFTCMLFFKNIFSFILTFFAYDWLVVKAGSRAPFIAIGTIQIGICLLAIPMYVFGKRNRSFFARHNILKALHL
ncbi:MFS transporter, putative [Talaromyces stipitatus ATCC 10500]|uniref:MFS transporter, putative n=1 Tax=Talaromyces stipitatus (strain ATCC 10500 / CBS 375.48 / QM 6759 / NRRL 1006) TaxID=441959 RepID=B8MKE7_TALSN|nr:MFS transporter, putative [Talaromyces stipitatus ATCC 10500]EED15301.1 MFS transporter, putative [Talaromyces stipitatus ATCC 10500]